MSPLISATCNNQRYCMTASFAALVFLLMPVSHATAAGKPLFNLSPASMQQDPTAAHARQLDRIQKEPTTTKAKLVAIDISSLNSDSIEITLDGGKILTYFRSRIETNNHGSLTWYGDLADHQGSAILVANKGIVTGSIRNHGELYKIESVGNGLHAVIESNSAGLPPDHPPSLKPGAAHSDHKAVR